MFQIPKEEGEKKIEIRGSNKNNKGNRTRL